MKREQRYELPNGEVEEDIKVLPEEGVSVQIGGETYNPAFPCLARFSCQIIIFLSDYDWEQIVLEASSQTNGIPHQAHLW